jgi:signal transduction histidine kinase
VRFGRLRRDGQKSDTVTGRLAVIGGVDVPETTDPAPPAAPTDQRRVGLGVAHEGNRTVLREWFDGEGFDVVALADAALDGAVDLCVVDPGGYEADGGQVAALRAATDAFLPVLLVAPDDRARSNPEVWDRVDDVMVTPLSPAELSGRTAALLDRRTLSAERARHRARLERQNERLDEFAGVVSHDLRNPLNVARGNVERARDGGEHPALADAAAALDRMERLVADVLALAREGEVVDDPEPFSLEDAATAAWSAVAADDASLTVAGDVTLRGDPGRLEQLLGNLFRNAVEHGQPPDAPDEVAVEVGPLADGGIYVADEGPGIPEDQRAMAFESGFSTDPDGTGFGLSIVRTIAEAHDWSVSVTDADGGGARFEVRTDG